MMGTKHNNRRKYNKSKKHTKTKKRRGSNKNFKFMNCSPAVKGKTPVNGSCFTESVLYQLKEAYNKHHGNNLITASNPMEIWEQLKHRMSTCDKEDCWLEEIKDESVRKKLDNYIFAPDHPKDWIGKPGAWLSNFDILEVLKQYETVYPNFKIIGPTPIDFDSRPADLDNECVWEDLCNFSLKNQLANKITKMGIVFNLDKHDKDGSHWVSMFVDLDDQYIFYLDSAGEKIKPEIDKLVKRIMKQGLELTPKMNIHFYENCPVEHQMGENECGMYCLYFIITMLTGKTENKVFTNYVDKIDFFKNKRIPDRYVNKFRKIYFNKPE